MIRDSIIYTRELGSDQGGERQCYILSVNVAVQTVCSKRYLHESSDLQISCLLKSQSEFEKTEVIIRNKRRQLAQEDGIGGQDNLWNTVSSVMACSNYMFFHEEEATCAVSRLGYENTCKFPIFMQPAMREVRENGSTASFLCCTDNENIPGVWWYDDINNKLTGLNFKDPTDVISYSVNETCDIKNIVFLCGEETSMGFISFGLGKLFVFPYASAKSLTDS